MQVSKSIKVSPVGVIHRWSALKSPWAKVGEFVRQLAVQILGTIEDLVDSRPYLRQQHLNVFAGAGDPFHFRREAVQGQHFLQGQRRAVQ